MNSLMKKSRRLWRNCRRIVCISAILWTACGPGGPPVQVAPKKADEPRAKAADTSEAAEAKFLEFSKEVEKLGSDEKADPDHLRDELNEILKLDEKYEPARFDMAVLEARQGHREDAAKVLHDMASRDPNFAPAMENITAEGFTEAEIDKAAAVYRKIIARYPKNQTSRLALARIYSEQKKYSEAITLCREVLQRQADAREAFRILARSYVAIGNTPLAELIIGRGLKASKEDPELRDTAAQILLERDDLAGGVAALKQVVRLDPNRLSARAHLAEIALSYRDFGSSAQQYEAILKQQPDATAVQINLGVCYKGMGRFDQAEKIYQSVLARDANNAAALWNSGVLYHRHLNKYDAALAAFSRYKSVAPPNDDKVGQVNELLADIGKLKNDQEAQRAREEHDQKKKAAVDAVCAATSAGKPADANAVGPDQERIEAAWQLMVSAQQTIQGGDVPGGEAAVQCAFALVPKNPTGDQACAPMHVMWTQILYQLGRVDEASSTITAALKCDPNNPDAQLIAQQLKELASQSASPAATPEPAAPATAPAPSGPKKKRKK